MDRRLLVLVVLVTVLGAQAVPGRLNGSIFYQQQGAGRSAKKRQLTVQVPVPHQEPAQQQQQKQHQATRDNPSPLRFTFTDNVKLQSIENDLAYECPNCADESLSAGTARWTMPLLKLGEKRYYLGIFFKANWYRASQYCRYHGMHLASISSQEENDKLEKHIKDFGLGHEHFWTSGTDQGEEGTFFWMANGRPVTFENWNTGEPNNFRYENGEEEHCLELWNRDGKGLKWNDSPCSFETFFVCEVH